MNAIDCWLVNEHTEGGFKFAVVYGSNGKYYAMRSESPYFCLESNDASEARQKGIDSLRFYRKHLPDQYNNPLQG
jgi:hypothetical protein